MGQFLSGKRYSSAFSIIFQKLMIVTVSIFLTVFVFFETPILPITSGQTRQKKGRRSSVVRNPHQSLCHPLSRRNFLRGSTGHYRDHRPHHFHPYRYWHRPRRSRMGAPGMGPIHNYQSPYSCNIRHWWKRHGRDCLSRCC